MLKFEQMDWQASVPRTESDVFVLSKGHAVPAWYAALIVSGDLPPERVKTLRNIDSQLQGHPDRSRLDLVDVSTGALGQGLSISLGRAQAKRLKRQDRYVFCVVGDGETQEGQIWEALMYAGARKLSNVILVVDHNRSQNDGGLDEILSLAPLADKLRSFRWHVIEVDGHDHEEIRAAILEAKAEKGLPSAIIAHTKKGYLGGDRVVLGGAHSGSLTAAEYEDAVSYLQASV